MSATPGGARKLLLPGLDPEATRMLEAVAQRRELEPGAELLLEGHPVRELVFLVKGELEVLKREKHLRKREHPIGLIGPGEVCGELELVDGQPAAATVRATKPSVIYGVALDRCEPKLASALMRLGLAVRPPPQPARPDPVAHRRRQLRVLRHGLASGPLADTWVWCDHRQTGAVGGCAARSAQCRHKTLCMGAAGRQPPPLSTHGQAPFVSLRGTLGMAAARSLRLRTRL